MSELSIWCDEDTSLDNVVSPEYMMDGTKRRAHDDSALRQVLGGIGHLIAHEYWCLQKNDPDAGLTYRQSALLVYQWVHIVGLETSPPDDSIST